MSLKCTRKNQLNIPLRPSLKMYQHGGAIFQHFRFYSSGKMMYIQKVWGRNEQQFFTQLNPLCCTIRFSFHLSTLENEANVQMFPLGKKIMRQKEKEM